METKSSRARASFFWIAPLVAKLENDAEVNPTHVTKRSAIDK
jgi:hypothetical protein